MVRREGCKEEGERERERERETDSDANEIEMQHLDHFCLNNGEIM